MKKEVSNFSFLASEWPILANLGELAERNLYQDSNTTLIKLRMFGETMAKFILAFEKISEVGNTTQNDRLRAFKREDLVSPELLTIFHALKNTGNSAVHDGYESLQEAKRLLYMSFTLGVWFMQTYGEWDFEPEEFVLPSEASQTSARQQELEQLNRSLEERADRLKQQLDELMARQTTAEEAKQRRTQSKKAVARLLNEAETRTQLIDEQLRLAGWEADSKSLSFKAGTRPEKGKNKAIAEWPVHGGRADYALFAGMKLVGLIEAKAKHKDVQATLTQTKTYAKHVYLHEEEILPCGEAEYKVPFLYATNGRHYLRQLAEKSGIWFWDSRKKTEHARPLEQWHSPADLLAMLEQDVEEADRRFGTEPVSKLALRPYQEEAILAVEQAIKSGRREMLVAMATGTGKTRMAIGLMYRFLKTKRFRRILFLVDRTSLGKQTEAALRETKLDGYTFSDIYDVKSLEHSMPELETKVHIATVQGLVKRIFYSEHEKNIPSIGQYDCIIVDEAHRGYTGDREMSDDELAFRDQDDYVSQYRRVLDYFDAVRIGLTATPALHTTDIFGEPIYTYSYRRAVMEGYLVDHDPPYQFKTELSKAGITFEKDEEVKVLDEETNEIRLERMKDAVTFEVEQFNKKVITESFNRAVLTTLAEYIDPAAEEKTLIFAATDEHADMVVRLLKEAFKAQGDEVEEDAVMKITGSIYKPLEAIKRFKNERLPNIVVTVDLLTTGIDVPKISNLVFLRRIQSRILYDQMLGRATRLCPEINKDHFTIYDAVGIYETLKKYTAMKPVVPQPTFTLEEVARDFAHAGDAREADFFREQLLGKVQRKKQQLTEEHHRKFEALSKGKKLEQWIRDLKTMTPAEAAQQRELFAFLEECRPPKRGRIISEHADRVKEVTRGYGEGIEKPEDYLDGFARFIKENINAIPALFVVCNRPSDLTRQDLRQLLEQLELKGYNEKALRVAWKHAKSQEVAADIISFIRRFAIGSALEDQNVRIRRAMQKVYSLHDWTPRQKKWLERIEKQLLKFPVLAPQPEAAFSEEPFRSQGGYQTLKREFGDEIDRIVYTINENLYIS
ncbi:type I restriction-modification system endonuclease [Aneurinibacillus sp. BA2021]|nr:type I restriction-modification system endonuclease [Aneurinibacillus sp. BA2021]